MNIIFRFRGQMDVQSVVGSRESWLTPQSPRQLPSRMKTQIYSNPYSYLGYSVIATKFEEPEIIAIGMACCRAT